MKQPLPNIERSATERGIEVVVHVLTWCYIFLSPLFFKRSDEDINWNHFLHSMTFPLGTCIAFYINYFLLIPRFVIDRQRIKAFVAVNVLMCLIFMGGIELQAHFHMLNGAKNQADTAFEKHFPPKIFFIIRGFLTFVFVIAASVALRLSLKWRQSERARAQAELRRSQAELKNLKNQINPHFLLNTLNNIYALTAFDSEKAQHAIHELSLMLRYMLYENQSDCVVLNKELHFMQSYIELMKLRIAQDVDVTFETDIEDKDLHVAPLIFISLVENAFKHGISPTLHSFIHIKLTATHKRLVFTCENSNFPKTASDKAPGGIGLKQVEARLELAYPGRYRWDSSASDDGSVYRSSIEIDF